MDAWIYNADVYCEDCARDIKARIESEGRSPANPDDERSYDSSEYPKGPFSDEESDTPEHCGSGPACLDPHVWSDGSKGGKFLGNPLTRYGEKYVQEMNRDDPSEVTRFWMDYYELDPIAPDEMVDAYIECALWSSTDNANEQGGEPLDSNYTRDDIDPKTLAEMAKDCGAFWADHGQEMLDAYGPKAPAKAGHDFWLTRCGHGAGFWDGDWPQAIGRKLTEACKPYGEYYLYVGDDGKIYGS